MFNPGTGTSKDPRATAQRLDMLLGVLGFFTLMAFIQVVVLELRGAIAVREALLLLALVVATAVVWRRRRRLPV